MPRLKFIWKMLFDGRGAPAPPDFRPEPSQWSDDEITGSCLGHSTVLMNFLGAWVLTDPVFSTRAGPGVPPFILGPKRYLRPALSLRELPKPDVIVLSHAHFDHFDRWTLRKFSRNIPIVTAVRTGDLLRSLGFKQIYELRWGELLEIPIGGKALRVTGLEVNHWGARMVRDNERGYNGYLLERETRSVCFAGDTAYTSAFTRLRERVPELDLMLMPVGAYDPWIASHCNPEQAAKMAEMARAKYFVPLHHETFRLSSEPMDEPARRIRAAFAAEPKRLLAVHVGETFRLPLSGSPVSKKRIQNAVSR